MLAVEDSVEKRDIGDVEGVCRVRGQHRRKPVIVEHLPGPLQALADQTEMPSRLDAAILALVADRGRPGVDRRIPALVKIDAVSQSPLDPLVPDPDAVVHQFLGVALGAERPAPLAGMVGEDVRLIDQGMVQA